MEFVFPTLKREAIELRACGAISRTLSVKFRDSCGLYGMNVPSVPGRGFASLPTR